MSQHRRWSLRTFVVTLVVFALITPSATEADTSDGSCSVDASDPTSTCNGAEKFQELMGWLQDKIDTHVPEEHRIGVPRIDEVMELRGRTFVAKRNLHPDDLLLRLPLQSLMHSGYYIKGWQDRKATVAAALAPALEEHIVFVAEQTWVAVYMMEHRRLGRESEWYPYLSLLPDTFPDVPIFYTEEQFASLKGSSFVQRTKKHLDALKTQFDTVAKLVPGFGQNYTLDEFLWARSAIATRVFGWKIPELPSGFNDFMVPLGDMFNHRSPKMMEWQYNASTNTLDYWVREEVTAGSEIMISYGTKSNSEYLLHYGFTVKGLPQKHYTACSVRVPVVLKGIPEEEAKKKWLVKASFSRTDEYKPAEFTLRNEWEKEPEKMLAHARLLELPTMQELERQTESRLRDNCERIGIPPQCGKPVSVENERAALMRLLLIIKDTERGYPTTFEEDEAKLPQLEGTQLHIVTLRRDEKFVLRWWEQFLSLAIEMVDSARPGKIAKRCESVLGISKCSVEDNKYMRVTLYNLLGGAETEKAQATSYLPYLFLFALMLVVIFIMSTTWGQTSGNKTKRNAPASGGASKPRSATRKK